MSNDTSLLVLACDHVLALERDVDLIVHHADGMWQLTCGQFDHSPDGAGVRPVHMHHLVERSPDLADVMSRTPPGHLSERTQGRWVLTAHDD